MFRRVIKVYKRFKWNVLFVIIVGFILREAIINYMQKPIVLTSKQVQYFNNPRKGQVNTTKVELSKTALWDVRDNSTNNLTEKVKEMNKPSEQHIISSEKKETVLMPRESLEEYPWQLMKYTRPTYIPETRNPCFYVGSRASSLRELFCMPLVYLAGFAKSGSSDLYSKICTHQHIISGYEKEAQFWIHTRKKKHIASGYDLNFGSFVRNYKTYTSIVNQQCLKNKKVINGNKTHCPYITIDGSADYLFEAWDWEKDELNPDPREPIFLPPHRIGHYIEHPKIIVLMRNPIERLFSDFKFFAGGKNGSTYFHTLVVNGIAWWENCTKTLSEYRCAYGRNYTGTGVPSLNPEGLCNWGDSDEFGHNGANRLRVSIYVLFIQKWLEVFSIDQFLFLTTEEYKRNALNMLTERIFPFLEVDPLNILGENMLKRSLNIHINVSRKNSLHMLPETRQVLEKFYRPYNERLANLLQDERFRWA